MKLAKLRADHQDDVDYRGVGFLCCYSGIGGGGVNRHWMELTTAVLVRTSTLHNSSPGHGDIMSLSKAREYKAKVDLLTASWRAKSFISTFFGRSCHDEHQHAVNILARCPLRPRQHHIAKDSRHSFQQITMLSSIHLCDDA